MSSSRPKDSKTTIYESLNKDTRKPYQDPLKLKPREFGGSLNDSLRYPSAVNKGSVYDAVNQKHKSYKGTIYDSLIKYPPVKRPEKPKKAKEEKPEPQRQIPEETPTKAAPTPRAPQPKAATPKLPEVAPPVQTVASAPALVRIGISPGSSVGSVSRTLVLFS